MLFVVMARRDSALNQPSSDDSLRFPLDVTRKATAGTSA
jgi:hypothetical protein